jgi:DNA repair exonuclease SbcCD nuclease subunit
MLIALITDTHFGCKNDSLLFQDAFKRFYHDTFFPTLRERGIRTIIHGGDLFERRKFINFHVLYRTRTEFLEVLDAGGYDTHLLVGNHDTYFRDSNDVNSLTELLHKRYPNFHIYEEPQEIVFDGLRMLFVPWLNESNMPTGLDMIKRSKAPVLIGHLEVSGFHMDQTQICEHGMDRAVFKRFKRVFSGHFHHPSKEGNIQYLGSPYEMTFADVNDPRGFYIFDTKTLELEFIENPHKMFFRLVYDDRDESTHGAMLAKDFSAYQNKFVRVVVPYKTNPILYEQWIDKLAQADPADFQVSEQYSLEVSEEAEDEIAKQIETFRENDPATSSNTTLGIVNAYIDAMGMDIDRDRLKDIIRELFIEAVSSTGDVNA